jgi:DNA replication protein DnaC
MIEKQQKLFKWLNIPVRYANASFQTFEITNQNQEKIIDICKKYVENFEKVASIGRSLLMVGTTGTGKTHLAYSIAKALILQKSNLLEYITYTPIKTIFDGVKATFNDKSNYYYQKKDKLLEYYEKSTLLIIDEVRTKLDSSFESEVLFELIDNRYNNLRPTIMISNLSLEELKGCVDVRVIDRMLENRGIILNFEWSSHRGKR